MGKENNVDSHLFAAVAGQVKREHREKRDPHAGDDDVHRVEEGLPPHRDVERDVQVRLVAAGVELLVSAERDDAENVAIKIERGSITAGELHGDEVKKERKSPAARKNHASLSFIFFRARSCARARASSYPTISTF